jgi:hypothetical protein
LPTPCRPRFPEGRTQAGRGPVPCNGTSRRRGPTAALRGPAVDTAELERSRVVSDYSADRDIGNGRRSSPDFSQRASIGARLGVGGR